MTLRNGWRPFRQTKAECDATQRLNDRIVAEPVAVWAILSKPCDAEAQSHGAERCENRIDRTYRCRCLSGDDERLVASAFQCRHRSFEIGNRAFTLIQPRVESTSRFAGSHGASSRALADLNHGCAQGGEKSAGVTSRDFAFSF